MVAQELHRLVQQLPFMLRTGMFVTPPQFIQNLFPCRLIHVFIHSSHGNPTFGTTYLLSASATLSRVTILLAQFASPHRAFFVEHRACFPARAHPSC